MHYRSIMRALLIVALCLWPALAFADEIRCVQYQHVEESNRVLGGTTCEVHRQDGVGRPVSTQTTDGNCPAICRDATLTVAINNVGAKFTADSEPGSNKGLMLALLPLTAPHASGSETHWWAPEEIESGTFSTLDASGSETHWLVGFADEVRLVEVTESGRIVTMARVATPHADAMIVEFGNPGVYVVGVLDGASGRRQFNLRVERDNDNWTLSIAPRPQNSTGAR